MMIKLSDSRYVAASEIKELSVKQFSGTITVRMKDGDAHTYAPEYRESVYDALDRLVEQVNKAAGGAA
ncbi:hypothetical protein D9M71_817170 [compost metagenome]